MPGRTAEAPNEFSRIVTPDRLGAPKVREALEAAPSERAAVARRLGILGIDRLAAELTVSNLGGRLYRVEGGWEAEVRQACVVTLEPVPARLTGRVQAAYEAGAPASGIGASGIGASGTGAGSSEIVVDPDAEDPAEPLPAEGLDLGELVVQELAVALDPYPRAPGAEIAAEYRPSEGGDDSGPFARLKALKGKKV